MLMLMLVLASLVRTGLKTFRNLREKSVGNVVLPEFSAEEHPPLKAEPTGKTNNSNVIPFFLILFINIRI